MEGEVFRLMSGLGIFKHDAVRIEGIAGNHSQAVIAIHTDQLPVLSTGLFHGNSSLTGNDLHLQFPLPRTS